jgi:hypothetical protein
MWGEIALQKVSETQEGEEMFVVVCAGDGSPSAHDGPVESSQMTEEAIRRVFGKAGRSFADMHAMFRVARQVFKAKAKRGEGRALSR